MSNNSHLTDSSITITDNVFNANGRFGRLSFFAWLFIITIIFYVIFGITAAIFTPSEPMQSTAGLLGGFPATAIIIFVILYIALLYLNIIFTIRRLHDMNKTGWLSLLLIIPLINLFFMLYLSIGKGTLGANNYGLPRITQGWEKVLGWIYIILVPITLLGIMAAIAIPAYQSYVERAKTAQESGYSQPMDDASYAPPVSSSASSTTQ